MGDEGIAVLLSNRDFLYAYTGRAFSDCATDELLSLALNEQTLAQCALLDEEDGGTGFELQGSIAACVQEWADGASSLVPEYTRLFIGPTSLPAPPWESVYVSHEPLLFQESTLAVREAYAREGFQATGYPHEADDHVATELNFMAALSERAQAAYQEGNMRRYRATLEAQVRFLDEHLLVWIREFADRLSKVSGISALYPSFAALAALVCERDADVVRELLEEV